MFPDLEMPVIYFLIMKRYLIGILYFFNCFQQIAAQDGIHYVKPAFVSKEINRVAVGKPYYYKFSATDSSSTQLVYTTCKLPGWLAFNAADHSLSGKSSKAGQYSIQLFATNGKDTASQFFMLTVYDAETTNILCLGNSITNGTDKYNSYRRDLWKMLYAAEYNFDMIGSWSKHHMGGNVPDPDFDMDHDGHSGWTAEHIFNPPSWDSARGNIYEWLKNYTPGIVLAELGTNDVFQCRTTEDVIKDFSMLVRVLRKKNKQVKIFIAQIPPLGAQWAKQKLCKNDIAYEQAIIQLNSALSVFAGKNNQKRSPVVIVDQYTAVNTAAEMYDDIHPNTAGERKMAERWFTAIKKYMNKLK